MLNQALLRLQSRLRHALKTGDAALALRVVIADLISPSCFPAIAAVERGFFKKESPDAALELLFPVTRAPENPRDGKCDFADSASHAPPYAFKDWTGARLCCAPAQNNICWFLVVCADLNAKRGDQQALHGLRIGAEGAARRSRTRDLNRKEVFPRVRSKPHRQAGGARPAVLRPRDFRTYGVGDERFAKDTGMLSKDVADAEPGSSSRRSASRYPPDAGTARLT